MSERRRGGELEKSGGIVLGEGGCSLWDCRDGAGSRDDTTVSSASQWIGVV